MRPWPTILAALAIAAALAGCGVTGEAPQAGCAAMSVSLQRCEAMVEEARARLDEHPPVVGVVVIPALQDAKLTLRAQNLLATVRFTYVDGSSDEIPVFCGPGGIPRPACSDRSSGGG
jgi:hypothetical protein